MPGSLLSRRIVPPRLLAGSDGTAGGRAAWTAMALLLVVGATAAVAMATRMGYLPLLAAAMVGVACVVASFRWPLLALFAYAAILPLDEITRLGPLGTVGRTAAILFVVAYAAPRLTRLRWRAMPMAAWAYLGWAVLSLGWAIDQDVAITALATFVQLFAMGWLTADVVVHRPGIVRPLLWAYTISASLTAVVAVQYYLAGNVTEGQRVAVLPGQDPAQYAAILLPALVFAAYQLLENRLVVLSAVAATTTGLAILLTGTRGAWVSVVVVAALLILPRVALRKRVLSLGLAALVLVGAFQIPGVADYVSQRTDLAVSSGGAGRTAIWEVGIGIFDSAPLIGVGFANFPVAFTPDRVESTPLAGDPGVYRAPHNIVIGTLGELGVVGLVLLVLFLAPLVLRSGWGPDGFVVQAMLASLLVDAAFLDVVSNRKQVWLIIGLAAGLAYVRDRARRAAPSEAGDGSSPVTVAGASSPGFTTSAGTSP